MRLDVFLLKEVECKETKEENEFNLVVLLLRRLLAALFKFVLELAEAAKSARRLLSSRRTRFRVLLLSPLRRLPRLLEEKETFFTLSAFVKFTRLSLLDLQLLKFKFRAPEEYPNELLLWLPLARFSMVSTICLSPSLF